MFQAPLLCLVALKQSLINFMHVRVAPIHRLTFVLVGISVWEAVSVLEPKLIKG